MVHIKAIVLLAVLGYISAETTTTPHPHVHHEHPESDQLQFTFEGGSGMLIAQLGQKCYLWSITPAEHNAVHTDAGLRSIEMRVLTEINAAVYTVIPGNILSSGISHVCKRATSFYLVH